MDSARLRAGISPNMDSAGTQSSFHFIQRRSCPVCDEPTSSPVSPRGNFRRCRSCGLLYRQTAKVLPPETGWNKEYYDRAEILQLHRERKSLSDFLVRLGAPASENSQWLDVGCGIGVLLSRVSAAGWMVSGIDPSSSALCHARTLVPQANVSLYDSLDQVPTGEMFDVVSVIDVLRHLENPVEEMIAFSKRLKPGGRLIVREVNSFWFPFLRKDRGDRIEIEVGDYLQEWNARNMEKMLLDTGYEDVLVKASPVFMERGSPRSTVSTMVVKVGWKVANVVSIGVLSSKQYGPNLIAIGHKKGRDV